MADSSSSSSDDGTPDIRLVGVNNFCSMGMRPHLMVGTIVQLLRQHFFSYRTIEEPSLRNYLWQADIRATGITIESITKWAPEVAGARPACIVRRHDCQFQRIGINDEYLDADTDQMEFGVHAIGSVTVFCISEAANQAERLGAEVYRELLGFSPILRSWLNLKRFTIASVGELFEIEEADEHYAVPVTVAYAYEERWTLRPHAPVLNKISLQGLEP